MVVFRCECDEVLGVDENSGDRLGECPSCGVIVRVPANAVSLKGRLSHKAADVSSLNEIPAAAPFVAATVAEPEIAEAVEVEVPAEVQEATFDAEIADLRANTVPPIGHAVEEGFAKHSADEVSSPAEEPIEIPQEVDSVETPQEVEPAPEAVAEVEPIAEVAPVSDVEPVAEASEAPVAEVAETAAEAITEEAPVETAPNKKKLSKRERLKLKKKNRAFEDAPVAEESAPVEAPVVEVSEEPAAAPVEEAPAMAEEPVAVAAEESATDSVKSKSGIKSGIKKPMGLKGKAAIGAASGARKGVTARAKKEAPAEGDTPKKGKSLLFIIGALVLAGAIGGAILVFREKPADGNGGGDTKAPTEEKKPDEAKTDAPADAPKTDAPKTDAPADAPQTEAPKADAPADAPKADAPKAPAPKAGTTGELPKEAPTAPAE